MIFPEFVTQMRAAGRAAADDLYEELEAYESFDAMAAEGREKSKTTVAESISGHGLTRGERRAFVAAAVAGFNQRIAELRAEHVKEAA